MSKKIVHNNALSEDGSILIQLPPITPVKLRCEVDYYGLSRIISSELGYKKVPRSFATWIHGWIVADLKYPEQFIWHGEDLPTHLVVTEDEAVFLQEHGARNVVAAGMPFLYADADHVERRPGSLLVMPPHGLPYVSMQSSERNLLDTIDALRPKFDEILFCIHKSCFEQNLWIDNIKKYGFKYVIGASADDVNALHRMQILFRSFEYMTTSTIGSHVVYAAYCGSKVFFSGDYYQSPREIYVNDPYYQRYPWMLDYHQEQFSEKVIKSKYPFLFKEIDGLKPETEWARKKMGCSQKKDLHELSRLLGWSPLGQLFGYWGCVKSKLRKAYAK